MPINLFEVFQDLLPKTPLVIGTILSSANGKVEVTLLSGGTMQALGSGSVGSKVFIMNGSVQSVAPSLTVTLIDI